VDILSISLDAAIATEEGDARRRQRRYAERCDSYTVVVKTDGDAGEAVSEGALRVVPTRSRTRYQFPVDAYRAAARRCREGTVDVVTTQDPFATGVVGWALARRFGLPLHVQVHADVFDNPAWRGASLGRRAAERVGRFVLARADAVRVGTEHERGKVRDIVPADARVHVAPVAIDAERRCRETTRAERERLRERLDLDDAPVVAFAGRFVPQKNLDRWVDVAERVAKRASDPPQFVLVGDGPERERIRRRFDEAGVGDRARFPGWVAEDELAVYYDLADVFLLTSDYEGTARVIVEAGLKGLPVVATPFAGALDNVEDGATGFVAEDVETLADRICWLLDRPEERAAFGEQARARFEDSFDPERLVEAYVEFLRPDGY